MCGRMIGHSVLFVAAVFANAAQATPGDNTPISRESTERFLAGVRDFAGGRLTPGPLYAPEMAGEIPYRAANAQGSPVLVIPAPQPVTRLARTTLAGRGTLVRRQITPNRITSPWGR